MIIAGQAHSSHSVLGVKVDGKTGEISYGSASNLRDALQDASFIGFKDAAAARKSWEGFRADPEWVAVKNASEEAAGGSLTVPDGVKSIMLLPTDFSPLK